MSADVIWVATLNEDYQPTPTVSYIGIGPRSVPRVLDQFRALITDREQTGSSTPSVLLVIDPDMDTGDLNRIVGEHGDRLGVAICRAVFPPSAVEVTR
jgi:hypothetical protein